MAMAAALPSVWILIVVSLLLRSTVSAFEFRVGGEKGWTEPHGDAAENYNHWASHCRFQVGDSLYFKYENDSLLEVTKEDYKRCYTANPLRNFSSGITTVRLDRGGLFFFISGEPGHCEAGQRLIVRVGSQPDPRGITASPAPAPYSGPIVVSSAPWAPAGAVVVALAAVLSYFMLH